jgi:hypothetical protein
MRGSPADLSRILQLILTDVLIGNNREEETRSFRAYDFPRQRRGVATWCPMKRLAREPAYTFDSETVELSRRDLSEMRPANQRVEGPDGSTLRHQMDAL